MTDKQIADLSAGVGEAQQAESPASEPAAEGAPGRGAEFAADAEDISMEEVLGPGTHKKPVANEDADMSHHVESQTV
jgi:hypothetical protein